jgi:hypothetical protein
LRFVRKRKLGSGRTGNLLGWRSELTRSKRLTEIAAAIGQPLEKRLVIKWSAQQGS